MIMEGQMRKEQEEIRKKEQEDAKYSHDFPRKKKKRQEEDEIDWDRPQYSILDFDKI